MFSVLSFIPKVSLFFYVLLISFIPMILFLPCMSITRFRVLFSDLIFTSWHFCPLGFDLHYSNHSHHFTSHLFVFDSQPFLFYQYFIWLAMLAPFLPQGIYHLNFLGVGQLIRSSILYLLFWHWCHKIVWFHFWTEQLILISRRRIGNSKYLWDLACYLMSTSIHQFVRPIAH